VTGIACLHKRCGCIASVLLLNVTHILQGSALVVGHQLCYACARARVNTSRGVGAVGVQVSQAEPLPPLSEGQVMQLKGVELSAGKTSVSATAAVVLRSQCHLVYLLP
jgi:hypothetical protein